MKRLLGAMAVLLLAGCHTARLTASPESIAAAVTQTRWDEAMTVVSGAAGGDSFQLETYLQALTFLESSTCIESVDYFTDPPFRRLPGPRFGETIEKWDEWWSRNRRLVRYDPDTGQLVFRDGRVQLCRSDQPTDV